jgi:hypothetical protein
MAQDCGLIPRNFVDSLAKQAGRTGIFRSRPSDLDLAAQGGSGLGFGWDLVEERACGKANSSRGTRRHARAVAGRAAVQGGAGDRGSPAWPKSATWAGVFGSGLLNLTQKV